MTLAESPGNAVFALYSYGGGQGVVANGSFTMPAGDVTLSTECCDLTPFGYSASYKADGSVVKPYVISATEGWEYLRSMMTNYNGYFQLTDPTASVREFKLTFDDEETTGVISTTDYTDSTDKASAIYDLQGRKVENPKKGLYIHGGRKVIVK